MTAALRGGRRDMASRVGERWTTVALLDERTAVLPGRREWNDSYSPHRAREDGTAGSEKDGVIDEKKVYNDCYAAGW